MARDQIAKVLSYWDLNRRSERTRYIHTVRRSGDRKVDDAEEALTPIVQPKRLAIVDQVLMYSGTVLGVFLSFLLRRIDAGETPDPAQFLTWFHVVFALAVAFLIVPYAYRRVDVDPGAPFLVRFGLFVQNGVFWQVIMGSLGKTLT